MSIRVESLSVSYGPVRALRDVDLVAADGSLTALLGPSGCGKTTLLRTIAGFERASSGRIVLDGQDVTGVPVAKRNVGFVFQHYALFPHLSVAANVAFALTVRHQSRERKDARVAELLDLVQLSGYGKRRPHELSGGQRQRVALARALAAEPRFLLLDEPFGALDVHVRRDLRTWLRELHDRTHVTTLLVTHDSDEAMEIADDLVVLRDGVVQQQGPPDRVYAQPANPFVMRFLGEVSVFDAQGGTQYVRPADVRVALDKGESAVEATLASARSLGPRTRLELRLPGGRPIVAELERRAAASLLARAGSTLFVEPLNAHRFEGEAPTR